MLFLQQDVNYIPFSSGALFVSIPNVDGNIPLFIVFRALGIVSDEQIVNMMLSSSLSENEKEKYIEFIKPSLIYRPNNIENMTDPNPVPPINPDENVTGTSQELKPKNSVRYIDGNFPF